MTALAIKDGNGAAQNMFVDTNVDGTLTSHISLEGGKATYCATITGLVPPAAATDIFTIIGSATKTIRISRIQFSGRATAAAACDVSIVKRSTADTGGTPGTVPTIVPLDSTDAAATAVCATYTAVPTLGTAVGAIRSQES